MRILWSIHLYPPKHNCGSEYVAHNINKYLISKGHHIRVILHQATMHKVDVPYMYEGVEVFPPTGNLDAYRWADVICTHLDYTQFTMLMASGANKPLFHFIHNDIEYSSIVNGMSNNYIVYNSKWVGEKLKYKWPSMVLPPPCDYDMYNVCDDPFENEFITLISLNKNKGGEQFYKIAEAMPDKKFLGVVGSYDEQIIRHDLPNVTIVPNTPDILSVYRKTKVLLMPSNMKVGAEQQPRQCVTEYR
jgi:glycosyltransferase involved in cell wall biosynthesis